MLTRDSELTPHNKFISDNLTHKPDVSQSAYDNYSAGVVTAPYAVNSFDKEYNESPRGKTVEATFDALKRGNQNPEVGWVQWGVNEAANMLGQTMNPMGFLFAEAGGVAIKPITAIAGKVAPAIFRKPITEFLGEKMGKYFPETLGTAAEKQTLSMGLFGKQLTKGFGIGAGASLPQATIDNFNAETNKHDILGIAEGMGVGGAFGMAISTLPFAWGILKANVNRMRGRSPSDPIPPDEINKMVKEGVIDEDTAQFMRDMDVNITPEGRGAAKKYQERATKYVSEQGHSVDHANDKAQFEILNRDQINNLQSATVDQLVSDNIPEEHRNALTDFTVQAGIDDMRNKPNLLDGVRGYVDYMDSNLAHKDSILAAADRVVDEHLELAKHETHAFDQQGLLGVVNKIGGENQHPFVIPEEVKEYIRLQKGIENYEKLSKEAFEKYEKTGSEKYLGDLKTINIYLESYKNKLKEINLLNAVEELKKIRSVLFPESEVKVTHPFQSKTRDLLTTEYGSVNLEINNTEHYETHGNRRIRQPPHSAQVTGIEVEKKHKGLGYGKKLYIEAIKHAMNKGLRFVSDSTLSEDAMRVYRSLQKMGYKFEEELDLTTNQFAGGNAEKYISKNNEPIFKLISAPLEINIRPKINKNSLEYQRLQDLAEVWQPAQTLLDRVNLEEEIRSQEAYRDIAKQMLDIADSNVGTAAKVENINGYMQARTNPRIDEAYPNKELIEQARENKLPSDSDIILAENDRLVEGSNHEQSKNEYEVAKEKFKDFEKSEGIFKNFINCVLGSQK